MRIPGFGSDCGCVAMASDAAAFSSVKQGHIGQRQFLPMPLSLMLLALLATLTLSSFAESVVMVDAEGDREKVLARGPRCVSFSSVGTKAS